MRYSCWLPFCGGDTLAGAYETLPEPQRLPEPNVSVVDIVVPSRICGSADTTFTVKLYNSGHFNGLGTLYLYIDGSLAASRFVEIYPSELLSVSFTVKVPSSGVHTVTARYEGRVSTSSRTETFEITDNDCDGWLNSFEMEYGTDPNNPDTDWDSVIDPEDVDPFRDAVVEFYLFRARALDPAEDNDENWAVDLKIEATFKVGDSSTTVKENLPDDTRDVENIVMLGSNVFENIQREAVAVLTFNPPDNVDTVEIDLKLVDRDSWFNPDDIMDISLRSGNSEEGKVAKLFFSLRNGTWWGDDDINDHEQYFGYGHLSGADDSTEDYTNGSEYDSEPFSKYYDDLEALGYDLRKVNITSVRGWDGIEEVSYSPGRNKLLKVLNPAEIVEFTLSLPGGKEKRVVLVNTRGAKVLRFSPPQKAPKFKKIDSVPEMAPWDLVKEEYTLLTSAPNSTLIKLKNPRMKTLVSEPKDVQIAQVSDIDEDDAEIWFLIKTNDDDGIPFYRELELNEELEKSGATERFDPSDGFGIDDPDEHQGFIDHDAYGDFDGDGVPNVVEQFIGKDPLKPDVLGIKLTVAVGWNADEDYLRKLVKGFQRASQVIYDYTDGYAMITEVNITNNVQPDSDEWEKYMVRIYPGTNGSVTAPIGWYWGWIAEKPNRFSEYVKLFETFSGQYPDGKLYYRPLAHELGHFVFAIADEYYTHRIFYIPSGKLEVIGYDNITAELSRLNITFRVLPTIMESSYEFTELSTPYMYEWFNTQLYHVQNTLISIYKAYGWYVDSLEDFTTSQWGDFVYNINGNRSVNPMSAWETVFALLSRNQTLMIDSSNGWAAYVGYPMNAGLVLDLDFDNKEDTSFPWTYIPKTGPYTGVGYYLRAEVS